jgi:pilus assembly protein CpaB
MEKKEEVVKANFFKSNQVKILFVSVLLGIFGALLVHVYIKGRIVAISGGELVPVLSAAKDIDAGGVITEDMLSVINKPSAILHQMAIEEKYKELLIGQKPAINILKNQVFLWTNIQLEQPETLSQKLKHNERAITINVDSASGLEGLVRPGDRVDVMGFFDIPGEDFRSTKPISKILLQNVSVLAVGRQLTSSDKLFGSQKTSDMLDVVEAGKEIKTITLKLSSREASIIMFAVRKGEIQLLLRSKEDVVVEPVPEVGFDDIVKLSELGMGAVDVMGVGQDGKTKQKEYSYPPDSFGKDFMQLSPEINKQIEDIIKKQQQQQKELEQKK